MAALALCHDFMMAWGYWTCYSSYSGPNTVGGRGGQQAHGGRGGQVLLDRQQPQNNELYYHHSKQNNSAKQHSRDRSLERESRQLLISNSTGTGNSASDNSSGGQKLSNHHANVATENHVEPEKVAFERRLLLGDPDWGSRTIADRNTLPRKKQPEYDKNSDRDNNAIYGASTACTGGASTSNSSRGRRGSSKMVSTPPDSLSRKSMEEEDDNFCPACAQNSNRESRVSFGSLASSSRGSSNKHQRTRSRSQDDDCDYSSDHGEGHVPCVAPGERHVHHDRGGSGGHHGSGRHDRGGGGGHESSHVSSSLPTPPPPPFCSQRDLIRHQASLLETINQKMAFLSAFKLPPAMNTNPMVQHQAPPPQVPNPPPVQSATAASHAAAASMNISSKYNTIGPSASAYYFEHQSQPPLPSAASVASQQQSRSRSSSHHPVTESKRSSSR